MKRAIVTGASGFVGKWLVKELVSHQIFVYAVVRSNQSDVSVFQNLEHVKIVYCDLKDMINLHTLISDRDIDVFYHLAWAGVGGNDRTDYRLQLSNAIYSCDCAKAASVMGCSKFISTGTITEKIAEEFLTTDRISENILYGISKHCAHYCLEALCRQLKLPFVWLRLANLYGPGNLSGNIACYTLQKLMKKEVPEFSMALQPYDLLYIKDAAKAIYLSGESKNSNGCYYVGSGAPRILREYLLTIRDGFGGSAQIALGKRPEDGLTYSMEWFDIAPLQLATGFVPDYSFERGVAELMELECWS